MRLRPRTEQADQPPSDSLAGSEITVSPSGVTWISPLAGGGLLPPPTWIGTATERNSVPFSVSTAAERTAALRLHAIERFLNRLENLRVGLFQLQLDVNFVVAAGLVGQVSLA